MTRLEAEQQEKERQHQQKDVLQSLIKNKGLTYELVDMLIEKSLFTLTRGLKSC